VILIESEIAMSCIRTNAVEGQFDGDLYFQLHNSCTTVNANNGRRERWYGSLFVKTFNYLVGSTSPGTILHVAGLQHLPTDEFIYWQHLFKENLRFPNNLELEKEYASESSIYDHNTLEPECQRIKRKYDTYGVKYHGIKIWI
jgi:hypothetical protein